MRQEIERTGILSVLGEKLVNLLTNLSVGDLDIVFEGAVVGHEGQKPVAGNIKLRASKQNELRTTPIDCFYLPVGIPDDEHWVHPCCEWRDRGPRASCQ